MSMNHTEWFRGRARKQMTTYYCQEKMATFRPKKASLGNLLLHLHSICPALHWSAAGYAGSRGIRECHPRDSQITLDDQWRQRRQTCGWGACLKVRAQQHGMLGAFTGEQCRHYGFYHDNCCEDAICPSRLFPSPRGLIGVGTPFPHSLPVFVPLYPPPPPPTPSTPLLPRQAFRHTSLARQ
jgi:hypothetical protein